MISDQDDSSARNQAQEFHLDVSDATSDVVGLVASATSLSKGRVKHAMTCGALWITRGQYTQRLRRAKRELRPHDLLHLYYNEQVLHAQLPSPTLLVDEGDYSVWYKPSGVYSQGSKWGDHATVARHAERTLKPERTAFTVHRLDRAASGLILIAHSKTAAAALAKLFRTRQIEKRYQATVDGRCGELGQEIILANPIDDRVARSMVTPREFLFDSSQTAVEVLIETGRKHQIRRHLAGLGHPVVGDRLYGSSNLDVDLQLRACTLAFTCPIHCRPREYHLSNTQLLFPSSTRKPLNR